MRGSGFDTPARFTVPMLPPFDDSEKLEVQAATDLVRLVGEHIALKPAGREYVGLCPFHDDSKPSMNVSPQKQIFKCFACGAGGDVFSFMMRYHKFTFPEALKALADRAGIELSRNKRGDGGKAKAERERIAEANEQALAFYQRSLKSPIGQAARDALDRRGIHPDLVQAFGLGYAPDGWEALCHEAAAKGWSLEGLEEARLIRTREKGDGRFDFLRHRLVFPIFNTLGRPIAFGGRKLREEDEPKYLNTPETPLFHKSRTLYGLHLAKKPIIDRGEAIIVEGYTDVIACHASGITHAVAALGTAATREHAAALSRFAPRVVLIFDADEAGMKAADRALEVFLHGDLDVAIAVLPDGLDPADLLAHEDGVERWDAAVDAAEDALAYQFRRMAERMDAAGGLTGRQRVAEAYIEKLAGMGLEKLGQIRRALVVQRLADILGMSEAAIGDLLKQQSELQKDRAARRTAAAQPAVSQDDDPYADWTPPHADAEARSGAEASRIPDPRTESPTDPATLSGRARGVAVAERLVIACLLRRNDLFHQTLSSGMDLDEAIPDGRITRHDHRRLYGRLYARLASGTSATLDAVLADLAESGDLPLCDLATAVADELDRALDGRHDPDDDPVPDILTDAADALLAYDREREHRDHRRQQLRRLSESPTADPTADCTADATPPQQTDAAYARLLEQVREQVTTTPRPGRLARIAS